MDASEGAQPLDEAASSAGAADRPEGTRARRAPELAAIPSGRGVVQRKIVHDKGLKEPSGIVFHPSRGTLFAVGDRGHVVELTRDGEVLQKVRLPEKYHDLEGVTVGPKGRIFAVTEDGPPTIVELDPASLEVRRAFKIKTKVDGDAQIARHENEGIEGLAWSAKERAFFALNEERPPRIVKLDVPLDDEDGGKAKIVETISIKGSIERKGSDLAIDERTGHFLVTEAGEDGVHGQVHEITRDGEKVRSVRIPGKTQEGFAMDDRGSAYVAQDDGGIIRIDPG